MFFLLRILILVVTTTTSIHEKNKNAVFGFSMMVPLPSNLCCHLQYHHLSSFLSSSSSVTTIDTPPGRRQQQQQQQGTRRRRRRRSTTRMFSSSGLPLSSKTTKEDSTTSGSDGGGGNNNNIVLQPSYDDPTAFDSYKIGSPRVHRYIGGGSSSGDGGDEEPHYVMWYHGRSQEMHNEQEQKKKKNDDDDESSSSASTISSLPPLSTGRIGRATSRNGIIWKKDRVGSASEDVDGVSLGINKDSWWSFDTTHIGLGNVLLPMTTPAVITASTVYLMFYMGGNHDETDVIDYMKQKQQKQKQQKEKKEDESSDEATTTTSALKMADAKVRGMKMKIGVAVSQDGKSWGRVEGDDPTGACVVPYDINDPNNDAIIESKQNSIEEELYCAWPEVTLMDSSSSSSSSSSSTSGNNNNSDEHRFVMFYSTMTKLNKEKCIARATSPDGFRWYKHGICLRPTNIAEQGNADIDSTDSSSISNNNFDSNGCSRCCIIQDAMYDHDTETWNFSDNKDKYIMYYDGLSSIDGKHRILKAISLDRGITWTKVPGIALDIGHNIADWDFAGVTSPHIIRMDDGTERMYYTGINNAGKTAIGIAKLEASKYHDDDDDDDTTSQRTWIREQATFSFA